MIFLDVWQDAEREGNGLCVCVCVYNLFIWLCQALVVACGI